MLVSFPTSVHANRIYQNDQVRHLKIFPHLRISSSGQFASGNFPELLKRIGEIYQGKIYFLDTRHDPHFELNHIPVSFKYDSVLNLSQDQIITKEKTAAAFYLNKVVTLQPNAMHGEPWEEMITHAAIVEDFIKNQQAENKRVYLRSALDQNGPLSDDQVETFLSFMNKLKSENAWLHVNSIVGGGPALLLVVMAEILQKATENSLETIVERYDTKFISPAHNSDFLNQPQAQDLEAQKKIALADFLKQFYQYIKTRDEKQGWKDWKSQNAFL